MSFGSNLKTIVSTLGSKFSQDFEHLSFGLSSFIKNRNLSLLNDSLMKSSQIQIDLQQELRLQQLRVIDTAHLRRQLAHDLFREDRGWKNSLQEAEKKQNAATSLFVSEFVELNFMIQRARDQCDHISSLSDDVQQSDHDAVHHTTFQPLESQFSRLRKAKSDLIATKQEAQLVKEKYQGISDLIKRFHAARDCNVLAYNQHHTIKTNLANTNKLISHLSQLVRSIKSSEECSHWPRLLTPRFWMDSVQTLMMGSRR